MTDNQVKQLAEGLSERVARAIDATMPDRARPYSREGAVKAALSAIQETHAIVPKEPTDAMLEGFGHHKHRVAINYKAMLEASPKL